MVADHASDGTRRRRCAGITFADRVRDWRGAHLRLTPQSPMDGGRWTRRADGRTRLGRPATRRARRALPAAFPGRRATQKKPPQDASPAGGGRRAVRRTMRLASSVGSWRFQHRDDTRHDRHARPQRHRTDATLRTPSRSSFSADRLMSGTLRLASDVNFLAVKTKVGNNRVSISREHFPTDDRTRLELKRESFDALWVKNWAASLQGNQTDKN